MYASLSNMLSFFAFELYKNCIILYLIFCNLLFSFNIVSKVQWSTWLHLAVVFHFTAV